SFPGTNRTLFAEVDPLPQEPGGAPLVREEEPGPEAELELEEKQAAPAPVVGAGLRAVDTAPVGSPAAPVVAGAAQY
ncbi:MAG TPA: hypothetical protein VJX67_02190, partial [Blastocatellia bacterium]|nr:hypothetical protein [Blastocatellia bacterium]